ncbi:DNA damage-inducible protein 1 [Dinochytrium kinnereticum]|nr:DNA damage-inducible protein 1 [Dinochytrium kinnereticum]
MMPAANGTYQRTEENVKPYQLDNDYTIEDVKALIEVDFGISITSQSIFHNGKELSNEKAKDIGVAEDDVFVVRNSNTLAASSATAPSDEVETIRNHILTNQHVLDNIRRTNAQLAESVKNPQDFRKLYLKLEAERRQAEERERLARLQLQIADPFDIDAQKRIEEEIRKEMIHQNYEVVMLYVNVEVNGHKLKAFVDSGAQATIMSTECAKKCNIMHLLDERFKGVAEGVGTAAILGRVHSAQIKIGKQHLPCSFTIMEGKMEFLFGLDMLKRHLACIDLEKNCLRINSEEISFLPEHELPDSVRESSLFSDGSKSKQDGAAESLPEQATSSSLAPETPSGPNPVQKLMDLGVSREKALMALKQTNGDVDIAASLLFM